MSDIDKLLDMNHSILIRLKYSDDNGRCNCYTCKKPLTFNSAQCGHYPYVSRGNMKFRWNLEIHRPQCQECNCFNDGLAEPFRDSLVSEFGFDKIAHIEFDSHKPYKWFKSDKLQLLKEFRAEIKRLLQTKNFTI